MNANVYEMYHGTVAGRVESIRRTGLHPSEFRGTLSSSLEVAWNHARGRSEADPVVLPYVVPGDQFDDYFDTPIVLDPVTFTRSSGTCHRAG
jgi:hypothetical protein